jgi:hypothetical protein
MAHGDNDGRVGSGYALAGLVRMARLRVPCDCMCFWTVVKAGLDALGGWEQLPTGRALLDHWMRQFGKAERDPGRRRRRLPGVAHPRRDRGTSRVAVRPGRRWLPKRLGQVADAAADRQDCRHYRGPNARRAGPPLLIVAVPVTARRQRPAGRAQTSWSAAAAAAVKRVMYI